MKWLYAVGVLTFLMIGTSLASTPAPPLMLQMSDGHAFDLSSERGHWVIINYWATWCEACREEMPMLSAFAASHPSVIVIGLTYEKISERDLKKFVAMHSLGYPVAHLDEDQIPHALKPTYFGIQALPLTYVVAPDGTVAKRWVGGLEKAKLEAFFSQAHP